MKYNPLFTHQSKVWTRLCYFLLVLLTSLQCNMLLYLNVGVCYVCLLGFYVRMHVFFWRFDRDDLPQVASSAREAQSELLALILLHSMWGRHSLFGEKTTERDALKTGQRGLCTSRCAFETSSLSSYQFIQIRECFCVKKSIASTYCTLHKKYPFKKWHSINMKEFSVFI